jgi:hypothetical protein
MRFTSATIFFLLVAMAMTVIAVSHFIETKVELRTKHSTSPEWLEHRKQANELEKMMQECKDPVELEKLYRQHSALIEQWKIISKPNPANGSKP